MASAESLAGPMATGATWMIAMRMADRVIGFVSMLILARVLFPEDFGLVATATAIVACLEVLSNFSFDLALIQNQETDRNDYDTAWTLGLIRGLAIAACLFFGAGPIAAGFGDSRLETILMILAILTVVQDAANIGTVNFRKDLELSKEFYYVLWPRITSFVLVLIFAVLLRNYWALMIGLCVRRSMTLLLSYWMSAYRPRLSLSRVRKIMQFSKWMILNSAFNLVNVRSPTLILGWISGATTVGFYALSHEISNLATSELVAPISRALYPAFSKIADQLDELRKAYLGVISLILLLGIPIAVGLHVTAEPAIHVLLGSRWDEAVRVVEVLAISGLILLFAANATPVLMAIGRPKLLTILSGISAVICVPVYIYGASVGGMYGLALGIVAVTILRVSLVVVIMFRVLELKVSQIFTIVWRTLISALVMAVVVTRFQAWLHTGQGAGWSIFELLLIIMVGVGSYVGVILVLWLVSGRSAGGERIIFTGLGGKTTKIRDRAQRLFRAASLRRAAPFRK